jgi:predicted nucleotide-binding protein
LAKKELESLKNIDIPSDLHGILYENYDSSGAWKMKLCKELIAVGIYVDIENVASKL